MDLCPAEGMLPHGSCWARGLQKLPHPGLRSCTIPGAPRGRGESPVGVLGLYISVVTPVQHQEGWGPCLAGAGTGCAAARDCLNLLSKAFGK